MKTAILMISFFYAPPATMIYTLSLHDALPICFRRRTSRPRSWRRCARCGTGLAWDRSEEQRLNSSHTVISYAVFCLKKKISYQQWKFQLHYVDLVSSHVDRESRLIAYDLGQD